MLLTKFHQQVKRDPQHIAVKTPQAELTYAQLDRQSDCVAQLLLEQGFDSKESTPIIGLLTGSATIMIAAIMGALKADCAYVPLSPQMPDQRIAGIVSHAGMTLILSDYENAKKAADCAGELTNIVIDTPLMETAKTRNTSQTTSKEIRSDSLLYILYTSGSTGQPKGVKQTHQNVAHFITRYQENLHITPQDRMTLFSAFIHDASIMDIFGALCHGATLYPLDIKTQIRRDEISLWLNREAISIWHSVPTLYRYFLDSQTGGECYPHLRYIVLGGEAVRRSDIDLFQKRFQQTALYNLYGQTESTYNSGVFITPQIHVDNITLGDPVKGTEIFVVDSQGQPVDPLQSGEILIASPHVSPGYMNDDTISAQVFAQDEEFGRLYWTGDLGQLLLDGRIIFIGRKDNQVKIRGFRVEVGEIESHLLSHPHISEAVVTLFQENQEDYLAAYIVSQKDPGSLGLRDYLAQYLPDYMQPRHFIHIEELPLTTTGKVDRKALPQPETTGTMNQYAAPRDGFDDTLVAIWAQVLNLEKETIGIDEDFFSLGGHSLRATVMAASIHQQLNLKFPMAKLFSISTIRGIADFLKEQDNENYVAIQAVEKKEYYPLAPAQIRLYLLQQLDPLNVSYNMTYILPLRQEIKVSQLVRTFQQLVARHDSLRTAFVEVAEEPMQCIYDTATIEIQEIDAQHTTEFIKPFDMTLPPLMRVGLTPQSDVSPRLLLLDMHHIITDGTSQQILAAEFLRLYNGETLPPLDLQYKDYAQWQLQHLQSDTVISQESYWLDRFSGHNPDLQLPTDFPRPQFQDNKGAVMCFTISQQQTAELKKIASQMGTTMYMNLLAVYAIFLGKICNQEQIIIGTPTAGRNTAQLQQVVGMFVNLIPLKTNPTPQLTFSQFLTETKEHTLKAFENQDYPFDELVAALGIQRQTARNPLVETHLVYQHGGAGAERADDFNRNIAKLDISLIIREMQDSMQCEIQYRTALFKPKTIDKFSRYFLNIIASVTANPGVLIADIQLLSQQETQKLAAGEQQHNPILNELKGVDFNEIF
jgi:amino acid adenylation domain-containing protein